MYLAVFFQSVAISLCKQHGDVFNTFRVYFNSKVVSSSGGTIKFTGEICPDVDILIANHQSMLDIFALEEVIGNDSRFIGRTGIMDKWPVSVIVARVGHITVNQKDKRAIIKLIKDVKVCKGKKVIIFPEGTRSRSGKIEKFEAGTKLLVEKLNLKAQPIVIKDILSVYDESKRVAKTGVIHIVALPPVTVEDGWYDKIQDDMKAEFESGV